jgi:hypothetical protein
MKATLTPLDPTDHTRIMTGSSWTRRSRQLSSADLVRPRPANTGVDDRRTHPPRRATNPSRFERQFNRNKSEQSHDDRVSKPTTEKPGKQPRATNPARFERQFYKDKAEQQRLQRIRRKRAKEDRRRWQEAAQQEPSLLLDSIAEALETVAADQPSLVDLLQAEEEPLPDSAWVQVTNIPPLTSLETMLAGIQTALDDVVLSQGIVDLDAAGSEDPYPLLELPETDDQAQPWVRKALLLLSPFARPTGWYLHLHNRSIVHALLQYHRKTPVKCGWKEVRLQPHKGPRESSEDQIVDEDDRNLIHSATVSDCTLRVEDAPPSATAAQLLHYFTLYDCLSVEPWHGATTGGKESRPTWLVHFADPSWARAALREKQATYLFSETIKPIRLAPYPKQML